MPYLVDSDIMVDFTRGNARAADYLGAACFVSAITALELIGGARNQREVNNLDFMISAYEQIPPNGDITRCAYYLMKAYARSHGMHTLDALIAANRHRRRLDARFEESKALSDGQRAQA